MKKYVTCFLLALLCLSIIPIAGNASEITDETIYYDDGSYVIIKIITNGARASGTVSGSKNYTYYNSDDVSQWKVVLTGKFTYTGSSATCTSSSADVTIYDSAWYVVSKSSSKSNNAATAYVVMGEKMDGSTVSRIPASLRLECDANGNLS